MISVTADIVTYDGEQLVVAPDSDISRELHRQEIKRVEVRLYDGREISPDQRKKIFAIIRDIALWSGYDPEQVRGIITWDFVETYGKDYFSLSDVDMTTARDFISYLINFCFEHNVPTKRPLIELSDDIGKYLYYCLEHRKCAICNAHADCHHVDRVGMGNNRKEIAHVGMRAIALCRLHHNQAHTNEKALFEKYNVRGIKLDKYLVEKLNL